MPSAAWIMTFSPSTVAACWSWLTSAAVVGAGDDVVGEYHAQLVGVGQQAIQRARREFGEASSVGAKTVNGPGPLSVSTSPAALSAVASVVKCPARNRGVDDIGGGHRRGRLGGHRRRQHDLSMTWITPLLAMMSAVVTVASLMRHAATAGGNGDVLTLDGGGVVQLDHVGGGHLTGNDVIGQDRAQLIGVGEQAFHVCRPGAWRMRRRWAQRP